MMTNFDYYLNKVRDILICLAILYGGYTINNILAKITSVSDDLIKTREELTSIKKYIISPEFKEDINKVKETADTITDKILDIKKSIKSKW